MRNFLLCLVLAVLISLAGCMQQQDKVDQTGTDLTSVPVSHDETYLSCLYYDESVFLYNLDCSKSYDLSRPPVIALSPHYNQAMFLTTSILQKAKDLGAAYQTVVILAPNHSGLGAPVQCANQSWQTPFGTCATDAAWVEKIVLDPEMKAAIDNERLVEDHSASTLIPYINYFFPEAEMIPILLGKGTSPATLQILASYLAALCEQKEVLVLGSVDFSHYLLYDDAVAHDQQTMELIAQQDIAALRKLDSGYLDSPETIITLLYLAQQLGDQPLALTDYWVQRGTPPKSDEGYSYMLYVLEQPIE